MFLGIDETKQNISSFDNTGKIAAPEFITALVSSVTMYNCLPIE